MNGTFLYSPEVAELARDLRRRITAGEISYPTALEVLRKALREAIDQQAYPVDIEDNN